VLKIQMRPLLLLLIHPVSLCVSLLQQLFMLRQFFTSKDFWSRVGCTSIIQMHHWSTTSGFSHTGGGRSLTPSGDVDQQFAWPQTQLFHWNFIGRACWSS